MLEILLDLLDLYPTLNGAAPLMQTYSVAGWGVINRSEVTGALRMIVGGMGRDRTFCTRGESVAPRNQRHKGLRLSKYRERVGGNPKRLWYSIRQRWRRRGRIRFSSVYALDGN